MSNMTYLCGTNDEQIYPSTRNSFDEKQQIICTRSGPGLSSSDFDVTTLA